MADDDFYHPGSRRLQDRFDSRRIADRLNQVTVHRTFTGEDRRFIEGCSMFFLATADAQGRPDCSYKGGMPGFVRILDERTLAFPDYDGNGMFRSLGNILVHPQVGLLFVDFTQPDRLRVQGVATVHDDEASLRDFHDAQLLVRVAVTRIFPNCPRYIHKMQLVEHSIYAPRPDRKPPVPEWKKMKDFRDALPGKAGPGQPRDRA